MSRESPRSENSNLEKEGKYRASTAIAMALGDVRTSTRECAESGKLKKFGSTHLQAHQADYEKDKSFFEPSLSWTAFGQDCGSKGRESSHLFQRQGRV